MRLQQEEQIRKDKVEQRTLAASAWSCTNAANACALPWLNLHEYNDTKAAQKEG